MSTARVRHRPVARGSRLTICIRAPAGGSATSIGGPLVPPGPPPGQEPVAPPGPADWRHRARSVRTSGACTRRRPGGPSRPAAGRRLQAPEGEAPGTQGGRNSEERRGYEPARMWVLAVRDETPLPDTSLRGARGGHLQQADARIARGPHPPAGWAGAAVDTPIPPPLYD